MRLFLFSFHTPAHKVILKDKIWSLFKNEMFASLVCKGRLAIVDPNTLKIKRQKNF